MGSENEEVVERQLSGKGSPSLSQGDCTLRVARNSNTDIFRMDREEELTAEKLMEFINLHESRKFRYNYLENMYRSKHPILFKQQKSDGKPDNRLVTNFAKYLTDVFEGYFIGIPVKTTHENEQANQYIEEVQLLNNQDDNNSELSKLCSIYGHAYELLFQDEDAQVGITYIKPQDGFIIYDNSIRERPLYGVRYYRDDGYNLSGSYSDANNIYFFGNDGRIDERETKEHAFGDVPVIEYVQNAERMGVFESVITLINDYNETTSEKSNDVDYFADAYLSLTGAEVDEKQLAAMRESRFVNIYGESAADVELKFLEKPNADTTQENHIERLEKNIFAISMIANISDENFGNASGVSLAYKLHTMSNLAWTKERKFVASMNRRFKLISNYPTSKLNPDDWIRIKYTFKRNVPKNTSEEATNAQALRGVVSHETILESLSIVDNPATELEKIKAEREKESEDLDDYRKLTERLAKDVEEQS